MADEIFVKLDGYDGDSVNEGHEDEFDVESVAFSGRMSFDERGGSSGRSFYDPVVFTTKHDAGIAAVFSAMDDNAIFEATVVWRAKVKGEGDRDFIKLVLEDARVVGVDYSLQDEGENTSASVSITLVYEKYTLTSASEKRENIENSKQIRTGAN